MSDTEMLTECVIQNPESDVVAFMLQDELVQSRDMLETEALRYVQTIRWHARQTRDQKEAITLVTGGALCAENMRVAVYSAAGVPDGYAPQIAVIAGTEPPRINHQNAQTGYDLWERVIVVVGAEWILFERKCHEKMVKTLRERERRARRKNK